MNIIKGNIPNTLTCLNILSGIMAIICAFHGPDQFQGLEGYVWAWIFIGIAAVADFLDGFAARTLNAYSEMGKELDSLCDNVSFGVAPALALFNTVESAAPDSWVCWVALVIPIAGCVRLARFNVDDRQTTSFIGLPIPANAIFWIGYMAMIRYGSVQLTQWHILLPIILVESWLMVSPVPMFSLKMKSLGWKGNEARWITLIAAIAFILTLQVAGLMWLIIFYVSLSLVLKGKQS